MSYYKRFEPMFAASVDEEGIHRLSIRRIRTVKTYSFSDHEVFDLRFKSRVRAKACADELNDTLLDMYDSNFSKETGQFIGKDVVKAGEVRLAVIDVLNKYRE